jgi:hypothetical protein
LHEISGVNPETNAVFIGLIQRFIKPFVIIHEQNPILQYLNSVILVRVCRPSLRSIIHDSDLYI